MNDSDRQLGKDRDAYQRLRGAGAQPRSVDGSADVERTAESPLQVAMGDRYMAGTEAKLDEAREVMADLNL